MVKVLVRLLCLMQLWALFRPTSNGAHKNHCTDQVMSCSYQKQPYPISWVFAYAPVQTSFFPGSETRRFDHTMYILQHLAREVKICLQDPFSVMWLSTSKVRWTGTMSMCLGNRKSSYHPQAWKRFTHSEYSLCHFKESLQPFPFHGKYHYR